MNGDRTDDGCCDHVSDRANDETSGPDRTDGKYTAQTNSPPDGNGGDAIPGDSKHATDDRPRDDHTDMARPETGEGDRPSLDPDDTDLTSTGTIAGLADAMWGLF